MPEVLYPNLAYRFEVEIEGLRVAGFSEVTGLEKEIELFEINEGGCGYTQYSPKGVKYPRLVLKKGIMLGNQLLSWFNACANGFITRKSGTIILQNSEGEAVRTWEFYDAFPVKCTGPALKAMGNEVAIESFELIHKGLFMR